MQADAAKLAQEAHAALEALRLACQRDAGRVGFDPGACRHMAARLKDAQAAILDVFPYADVVA